MEGLTVAGFRRLFYIVTPNETSFESLEATPDFVKMAVPWFMLFVIVEFLLSLAEERGEGRQLYSINDSVTSVGAGLLQSTLKILSRGLEFRLYVYVYTHYHVVELPWNSTWTWLLGFVAVDFAYYWFHRAGHELLLGWSFHQMHHSSEYYNFSTALRQGALQSYFSMFFYIPAALVLPPQVHLTHAYLNLLYQFWIHTQLVGQLGPLEWILNTPSHHRVHHGRNPYCIDKNYAGTLIIWDRLFGTFQAEKSDEQIHYGLTHPLKSFNQLYAQLWMFPYAVWRRPRQMGSLWMAVQAPWRGPGWGYKPVAPVKKGTKPFCPEVPNWLNVYVSIQYVAPLAAFIVMEEMNTMSEMAWNAAFIIISLQCFGMLFDKKRYGECAEAARAAGCLVCTLSAGFSTPPAVLLNILFGLSSLFWLTRFAAGASTHENKSE